MSEPTARGTSRNTQAGAARRLTADGKRVYRMVPPLIVWWGWIALMVFSLGDLVIQGHEFVSLEFGFVLLAATGLVFACTLWPRVIADDDGLTVRNPFRSFAIPWGAVKGIFLADSVEVRCIRAGQKKDKTVFTWALSAPRRARARSQLRGRQWEQGRRNPPAGYDRMSGQAKEILTITPAEVIARELAALSDQAKEKLGKAAGGTELPAGQGPGSVMSARWAWQPAAAVVVPLVGFLLTIVTR
jgi:hypothetical protein